jgi:phosphoribosylformylglycinamidine cyclo-ligase
MNGDDYKSSGVDQTKADSLIDWLKLTSGSGSIGPFAGALEIPQGYKNPLLFCATDGVGTKTKLALQLEDLSGIGIDLVAMCVNDLYAASARPIAFLDYYASNQLIPEQFKTLLNSILKGLKECSCPLIGGETAETPQTYQNNGFDLAGFAVGIAEKSKMIQPGQVRPGDQVYAFPASGFHSNGYTLLRKWLAENSSFTKRADLKQKLLTPTFIYSKIPKLIDNLDAGSITALAHITGGGLSGNLARALNKKVSAKLNWSAIQTPDWMSEVFHINNVTRMDVETVFNLGVGMTVVVKADKSEHFENHCRSITQPTYKIGEIIPRAQHSVIFET